MNYTQPIETDTQQKEPILQIWRKLKEEEQPQTSSEEQDTSHTVDKLPVH